MPVFCAYKSEKFGVRFLFMKNISEKDYISLLESILDHVSEAVYASNIQGEAVYMNHEAEITEGVNR